MTALNFELISQYEFIICTKSMVSTRCDELEIAAKSMLDQLSSIRSKILNNVTCPFYFKISTDFDKDSFNGNYIYMMIDLGFPDLIYDVFYSSKIPNGILDFCDLLVNVYCGYDDVFEAERNKVLFLGDKFNDDYKSFNYIMRLSYDSRSFKFLTEGHKFRSLDPIFNDPTSSYFKIINTDLVFYKDSICTEQFKNSVFDLYGNFDQMYIPNINYILSKLIN